MALVQFKKSEDLIGIITLNDPENLNAMSEAMSIEFDVLVRELKKDKNLRSIIITGAGRAFSAGGDLEMLKAKSKVSPARNKEMMLDFYNAFLGILHLNLPIIAAINGHAIGAGMCLASACDIRIVASDAKLGYTFSKLGLHPGMGASFFVPRLVGMGKATELFITGKTFSGDQALQIGLVSEAIEKEKVLDRAKEIASELLFSGPKAIQLLLETMRPAIPELHEYLIREAGCQSVNYTTEEFLEGVQAVIDKRKPKF